LEALYGAYNRREYVSPDPLEFLYLYDAPADREAVGLIASSLAYGRVASILSAVRRVLGLLGRSPAEALASAGLEELREGLSGFAHRFASGDEIARFLYGAGRAIETHGSLERLFLSGYRAPDIWGGMENFADAILDFASLPQSHLLPRPSKGSACKRMALFLRWMAREDDVDPGGWNGVSPRDIIVPLDTHMHRISSGFGFLARKAADGKAAALVTEGFRAYRPDDPVRYDFALTRFGIRSEMSVKSLLEEFREVSGQCLSTVN